MCVTEGATNTRIYSEFNRKRVLLIGIRVSSDGTFAAIYFHKGIYITSKIERKIDFDRQIAMNEFHSIHQQENKSVSIKHTYTQNGFECMIV